MYSASIPYLRPMERKKIVVLTGAGISAESGISTFRDSGGLWEGHDIMEVASPEGWRNSRETVLKFYNLRRAQLPTVNPNPGHLALVELESAYDVTVITQNVDDLHERAGSSHIIHLHGELTKARSTLDSSLIYDIGYKNIELGDTCEKGSQLRPHIVWFGEGVPQYGVAEQITQRADILIIVGTSLVVYPAAGLKDRVKPGTPVYLIDPHMPPIEDSPNLTKMEANASTGVPQVVKTLLNEL